MRFYLLVRRTGIVFFPHPLPQSFRETELRTNIHATHKTRERLFPISDLQLYFYSCYSDSEALAWPETTQVSPYCSSNKDYSGFQSFTRQKFKTRIRIGFLPSQVSITTHSSLIASKLYLYEAQKTLPPLPSLRKFIVGLTLELLILIFLKSEWSLCKIEFILLRINGHIHLTTLTPTYMILYCHGNNGNIYCIILQRKDFP